jgi:protein O-GlcNAc transferase
MFSLADMLPDLPAIEVVAVGAMRIEAEPYDELAAKGRARIVGFEPNWAECEKVARQYGPSHRFLPHFIGRGGPATYYETNQTMTGSLYPPNTKLLERFENLAELTRLEATHPVETRRLDDLAEIADIDFLKIDVQGAELDVLSGAERLLRQTVLIQIEVEFVEMYEGQPLFADIDRHLRQRGFQFHTFRGFGSRMFRPLTNPDKPYEGINQLLWSDAVYVADFLRWDRLAAVKLTKLAVLLHDVLRSFDLCANVLAELDRREGSSLYQRYGEGFKKFAAAHGAAGRPA